MSCREERRTYFPIKIRETESGNERIVASPSDIPDGVGFRVLECNVEADTPVIVEVPKEAV